MNCASYKGLVPLHNFPHTVTFPSCLFGLPFFGLIIQGFLLLFIFSGVKSLVKLSACSSSLIELIPSQSLSLVCFVLPFDFAPPEAAQVQEKRVLSSWMLLLCANQAHENGQKHSLRICTRAPQERKITLRLGQGLHKADILPFQKFFTRSARVLFRAAALL